MVQQRLETSACPCLVHLNSVSVCISAKCAVSWLAPVGWRQRWCRLLLWSFVPAPPVTVPTGDAQTTPCLRLPSSSPFFLGRSRSKLGEMLKLTMLSAVCLTIHSTAGFSNKFKWLPPRPCCHHWGNNSGKEKDPHLCVVFSASNK